MQPAKVKRLQPTFVETILRQVDAGRPWDESCAELMAEANITEADVKKIMRRRAKLLIETPAIVCALIVLCDGLYSYVGGDYRGMYAKEAAWIISQTFYFIALREWRRDGRYFQPQSFVSIGLTCTIIFYFAFSILLPPYMGNRLIEAILEQQGIFVIVYASVIVHFRNALAKPRVVPLSNPNVPEQIFQLLTESPDHHKESESEK
jgi:hypothetical protein